MNILKKLIKTKEFFAVVCFYILSTYIYIEAGSFPVIPGVPRAQNAGFYPKLISGLLIMLSTIYLIQIIIKIKKNLIASEEENSNGEEEKSFWAGTSRKTRIYLVITFLMIGIYMLILKWVGFASAVFVFLLVTSKILSSDDVKLYKIIMFALIMTVVVVIVFDLFIRVRFPEGILF